jgi:hypothetical protein
MILFHKGVVFLQKRAFKAYNSKNNTKNNNCYNFGNRIKSDLCQRLRILFVSSFESDLINVCNSIGFKRKKYKKGKP